MLKIIILVFAALLMAVVVVAFPTDEGYGAHCTYEGIEFLERHSIVGPIGECIKMTCVDPKKNSLLLLTCPTFLPLPGCHVGNFDLTQQYPYCCPNHICLDSAGKQGA